jgi:hypothetical protein
MNDEADRNAEVESVGPTVLTGYGWEGEEEPGSDVVEAVASATSHEPECLPVLHEAVEADALNALVSTGGRERARVTPSTTSGRPSPRRTRER